MRLYILPEGLFHICGTLANRDRKSSSHNIYYTTHKNTIKCVNSVYKEKPCNIEFPEELLLVGEKIIQPEHWKSCIAESKGGYYMVGEAIDFDDDYLTNKPFIEL